MARTEGTLSGHRVALGAVAGVAVVGGLLLMARPESGAVANTRAGLAIGSSATTAFTASTAPPLHGVSEVTAPPTTVPAPPPAPGTFVTAPGQTLPVGTGPTQTYTVEVETATGVDPIEFADLVDATLADPRSWTIDGSISVQRVAAGGDARVILATPGTTDALCSPLRTNGRYSCGHGNAAVINLDRWQAGVDVWTGPLEEYRHYVVNHEFGHLLGHDHLSCPGAGAPAPVMMQQTKGLDGCLPNGWPYP